MAGSESDGIIKLVESNAPELDVCVKVLRCAVGTASVTRLVVLI